MNPGLVGAVLGALAVMTGAFGAHGLESRVSADDLVTWEIAVRYQMYHALALLGVAALRHAGVDVSGLVVWSFVIGVLVFSGTLYAIALGGPKILGAVTPIGGVALIVGWAGLAWALRAAS